MHVFPVNGTTNSPLGSARAIEVVDDDSPAGATYLAGSHNTAWIGRFASAP